MRTFLRSATLLVVCSSPLFAQEGGAASRDLLSPSGGMMIWTLVVFGLFFFLLRGLFYKPMTEWVLSREKALADALDAAKRDRDESARILAEHKAQLDASRTEAQKLLADGRAAAEKMRTQVLEDTKKQQDELLARAARDIDAQKTKAIAELRREAIDLALMGASRVIEKNLDDATNRKLVEDFLSTVGKA